MLRLHFKDCLLVTPGCFHFPLFLLVHRMVCRAGACRRAASHWENGPPTSGGPTSD